MWARNRWERRAAAMTYDELERRHEELLKRPVDLWGQPRHHQAEWAAILREKYYRFLTNRVPRCTCSECCEDWPEASR